MAGWATGGRRWRRLIFARTKNIAGIRSIEASCVSSQSAYSLDAVNARGVGVRIAFERSGDQFSHIVYGVRQNRTDAVLRSVDSAEFDGWPASVAVQEVRLTPDSAGGEALVLMGAAAGGHWSATVRVVKFEKANPRLEFDVAVRLTRSPAFLGATYETTSNASWTREYEHLAFVNLSPHLLTVAAPLGFDDSSPDRSEELRTWPSSTHPQRQHFAPTAGLSLQYPATYRWQYCIASAPA
jgi:hypothetical protein